MKAMLEKSHASGHATILSFQEKIIEKQRECPNPFYLEFVKEAKLKAEEKDIPWHGEPDEFGSLPDDSKWNLSLIAKGITQRSQYLIQVGLGKEYYLKYVDFFESKGRPAPSPAAKSKDWVEFIKAYTVTELLMRRRAPETVVAQIRALRVLGACSSGEPWEVSRDDLDFALEALQSRQDRSTLNILWGLASRIDTLHLSNHSPLQAGRKGPKTQSRDNTTAILEHLEDIPNPQQLPEKEAFWELAKIIFTKKPETYVDLLRFSWAKLFIACGIRLREMESLPYDWRISKSFFDYDGTLAGERGGYSEAVSVRMFREKSQDKKAPHERHMLHEVNQDVPPIFLPMVEDTLQHLALITAPIRETMRLQAKTGRALPWYKDDDLIPLHDAFAHFTGNPFFYDMPEKELNRLKEKAVASSFGVHTMNEIKEVQRKLAAAGAPASSHRLERFFTYTLPLKEVPHRDRSGVRPTYMRGGRINRRSELFVLAGDVERWVEKSKALRTDHTRQIAGGGSINDRDLMFLSIPCLNTQTQETAYPPDFTRAAFFSPIRAELIVSQFGGNASHGAADSEAKTTRNIFERYGDDDKARSFSLVMMKINSHAFRHLQNDELLRHNVSDLVVTLRFRKSQKQTMQSYFNPRLREKLAATALPDMAQRILGDSPAGMILKMINQKVVKGKIRDSFEKIQREQGEETAYEWLLHAADGLHITPYGFCANGFTVDPCPNHLQCFNNCRNLASIGSPKHKENLIKLEKRVQKSINEVRCKNRDKPGHGLVVGYQNLIEYSENQLSNIRRVIETQPGDLVFPDGEDLSRAQDHGRVQGG
jgi:hypothetical protein